MNKKKFREDLLQIADPEQVFFDEPLKNHTTFRIGGPADYFVCPDTVQKVKRILELCKTSGVDCYILGNGSNVLCSDQGYRGMVMRIGAPLDYLIMTESPGACVTVKAGAGIAIAALAAKTARSGLTGLEFAGGIPGTLGGGVLMNAGAYGGEIADTIVSAEILNGEGQHETLGRERLQLSYRDSILQHQPGVILGATFVLHKDDPAACTARIEDFNARRREKQPLEFASAGSTFKRPKGAFAGPLIQNAGLQGYRVGDLEVSTKHAGFVINHGQGTCEEALAVIRHVIEEVERTSGYVLEPEVRIIGDFS